MAFLDDMTEQEVNKNKAIRGYIIRALARGSSNSLYVKQLTNTLVADNRIVSSDISKYLEYLRQGGYISFKDKTHTAYNAYRKDGIVELTKKGVDLVEGTIDDLGIDV